MREAAATELIELMERYEARIEQASTELEALDRAREVALEQLMAQAGKIVDECTQGSLAVMRELDEYHQQWSKEAAAIQGESLEVDLDGDPIGSLNDETLDEEGAVEEACNAIQELIDYEDRGPADCLQALAQMSEFASEYITAVRDLEYDEEEDADEGEDETFFTCDDPKCEAESPAGANEAEAVALAEQVGWSITAQGKTYCRLHAR